MVTIAADQVMAARGFPLVYIDGRKGDFLFFLDHIWWLDKKLLVSLTGRRGTCSLALVARRRPMGLVWRFPEFWSAFTCLLGASALDLWASWPHSTARRHAMLIASSERFLMGPRATRCLLSSTPHNFYLC